MVVEIHPSNYFYVKPKVSDIYQVIQTKNLDTFIKPVERIYEMQILFNHNSSWVCLQTLCVYTYF